MGLRIKIILPLLLSGLLIVMYLYAFWLPRLLADAEDAYKGAVINHLDSVAEGLVPLLLGRQLDAVYGNLDALLKKNESWASIELFDPKGRLLYPLDALTSSKGHNADDDRTFKQDIRYLDTNLGNLVVNVCFTKRLDVIKKEYARLLYLFFIVMFFFFLTTGFILELLVRRPIKHLADASQRLAEGDFEMHFPRAGNDEIGTLMKSFVTMRDAISLNTGRLSNANEQLRLEVNERKQAEEALRESSAQLEAVNRELESFAYVVSHDLKAPLRGVASLSNWLMADYADKLDDEGRQSLSLLVSRVTRMNNMIDGILHYSRVGRIKEELVEVDLKPMLDELIDMLTVPTHIEIKVETEMPTILCEKTRIFQVFQNLLSNAVKYMDKPKGMIRIGCVDEGRGTQGFHTFYVADNGPGIEAQYFEKIFQIFQTLKPRDELESTGVGLTIAKKIVELQGGKIWVESKPGEGSTFWFTIAEKQVEKDKNSQSEKFNVVESEGAK
ncbi:MAG: ATP-binding protein [Nitrospirota bacterium]